MPDRLSATVRGDSPVVRGHVIHGRSVDGGGAPLTTTDSAVVLGAGWGGTATFAIADGSFQTKGTITVTASASTPAQATATIVLTFDPAFLLTPKAYAARNGGTGSALICPIVACTTTAMTLTACIIPVAASTYTFDWIVVPSGHPRA